MSWYMCQWRGKNVQCDSGYGVECDDCHAISQGIESGTHCLHGNLIPFIKDTHGTIGTDLECNECALSRERLSNVSR